MNVGETDTFWRQRESVNVLLWHTATDYLTPTNAYVFAFWTIHRIFVGKSICVRSTVLATAMTFLVNILFMFCVIIPHEKVRFQQSVTSIDHFSVENGEVKTNTQLLRVDIRTSFTAIFWADVLRMFNTSCLHDVYLCKGESTCFHIFVCMCVLVSLYAWACV